MPGTVELTPIASSCVAAAGYDQDRKMLYIEFHKTGYYTYFNVSPEVFMAFMASDSKGVFVNKVFKQSNWPYQMGLALPFYSEE